MEQTDKIASDQIKQLFLQFSMNEKEFEKTVYYRSLSQILSGLPNIEIELMNFKDTVDLFISESKNIDLNKWKRFSFCIRRVAQKLYIKHNGLTEDERFLKIIS